jgi:hypothetical protein
MMDCCVKQRAIRNVPTLNSPTQFATSVNDWYKNNTTPTPQSWSVPMATCVIPVNDVVLKRHVLDRRKEGVQSADIGMRK